MKENKFRHNKNRTLKKNIISTNLLSSRTLRRCSPKDYYTRVRKWVTWESLQPNYGFLIILLALSNFHGWASTTAAASPAVITQCYLLFIPNYKCVWHSANKQETQPVLSGLIVSVLYSIHSLDGPFFKVLPPYSSLATSCQLPRLGLNRHFCITGVTPPVKSHVGEEATHKTLQKASPFGLRVHTTIVWLRPCIILGRRPKSATKCRH